MTAAAPPELTARRRLGVEVTLVLALSLGQSAIYSVLRIVERLTRGVPLSQQSSTLNPSVTPDRPWLDLAYQLAGVGFNVVPAVLVWYLLSRERESVAALIGVSRRRLVPDAWWGVALAAAIGVPGLGLYFGARALGLNTQVQASALTDQWWTVPVLILAAGQNAVLEEVVVLGYLYTRLRQLGWRTWWIVAGSAVLRGSYHLYQGFGGFIGNLVMGLIFGAIYVRWRRIVPLVVAHTVLDIVAFVGYAVLAPRVGWL